MGSDDDKVNSCIQHLVSMAEDFMDDADDWMDDYIRNPTKENVQQGNSKKNESKGFEVAKGAPWQGASDDAFPTLGGPTAGPAVSLPAWGPRR